MQFQLARVAALFNDVKQQKKYLFRFLSSTMCYEDTLYHSATSSIALKSHETLQPNNEANHGQRKHNHFSSIEHFCHVFTMTERKREKNVDNKPGIHINYAQ